MVAKKEFYCEKCETNNIISSSFKADILINDFKQGIENEWAYSLIFRCAYCSHEAARMDVMSQDIATEPVTENTSENQIEGFFKVYYTSFSGKESIEKSHAIEMNTDQVFSLITNTLFSTPESNGYVILIDSQGSEILILCPPVTEGEERLFEIEVPYFYSEDKTNVAFGETNREWEPKPIRMYGRMASQQELKHILNTLPTVFYQDCIPGCVLGRSAFYRD